MGLDYRSDLWDIEEVVFSSVVWRDEIDQMHPELDWPQDDSWVLPVTKKNV